MAGGERGIMVRMDGTLKARLELLAEAADRSQQSLVRELIREAWEASPLSSRPAPAAVPVPPFPAGEGYVWVKAPPDSQRPFLRRLAGDPQVGALGGALGDDGRPLAPVAPTAPAAPGRAADLPSVRSVEASGVMAPDGISRFRCPACGRSTSDQPCFSVAASVDYQEGPFQAWTCRGGIDFSGQVPEDWTGCGAVFLVGPLGP